jgi:HK97 family phage major capsid protein
MSKPYIDSLRTKFDELTADVDTILERALDEDREVTEDEKKDIDRIEVLREQLQTSIDRAVASEERSAKVAEKLGRVTPGPTLMRTTAADPVAEILRDFPTVGHWAAAVHRATTYKDPAAMALLERTVAHQITTDNPGLIPRPIVAPLIDLMTNRRRFVVSIGGAKSAPAGEFDRPRVTQHTDVGVQATEKTEVVSRKMLVEKVPVALQTFAGYLNISKQDIRWSQPSILSLVYADFVKVYARQTNTAACTDFNNAQTVTAAVDLDAPTVSTMDTFFATAATNVLNATDEDPTTVWMSVDMRAKLSQLRTPTGMKAYNIPLVGTGGDVEGLTPVVDPRFPVKTLIVGLPEYVECWEDLEGFLSVEEPGLVGQQVGYAGYFDTVLLAAGAFTKAADTA